MMLGQVTYCMRERTWSLTSAQFSILPDFVTRMGCTFGDGAEDADADGVDRGFGFGRGFSSAEVDATGLLVWDNRRSLCLIWKLFGPGLCLTSGSKSPTVAGLKPDSSLLPVTTEGDEDDEQDDDVGDGGEVYEGFKVCRRFGDL